MDEIRVSAAKQRLELRLDSLLQVCTRLAFSLSFGLREKTGHQVTTFTTWIARFVYGICWHVYCPVCPDPDPEQSAPTCSAHYGGVREAPLLLGFGRDALRSSWREKVEKEMTTTCHRHRTSLHFYSYFCGSTLFAPFSLKKHRRAKAHKSGGQRQGRGTAWNGKAGREKHPKL